MDTHLLDNKGHSYNLFSYQITGADLLLTHPRYILYWDCGVGKTLAAVAALNALPRGKVLIASPKDVRFDMWEKLGITINHDVTYLHYNLFPRLTGHERYDYIIFDECHKIKGARTQTGKIAKLLSKNAKCVWGMSATVAANSYVDTFRILRAMGVPEFDYPEEAFVGRYYNTFNIPVQTRFGMKNIVKETTVRKQFVQELADLFGRYCDSIDLCDVHELPPRHDETIFVDNMITEEYELALQGIIKINQDDAKVVAKLEAYSKVKQAAGGFMYYTDLETNKLHAKRLLIPNPKLEKLREVVSRYPNDKMIIVYSYRYEKQKIEQLLKDMGRTCTDDLNLLDYSDILLRQINCGEGLNLQGFAHIMIMYSYDYSYISWKQMQGRIFRVGQTEETTFITFISRDTIEEKVYDAINHKYTLDEFLRSVTKHEGESYGRI